MGYAYGPLFLAPLVALCAAVLAGHRRLPYAITAVAVVALVVVHMLRNPARCRSPAPQRGWPRWPR